VLLTRGTGYGLWHTPTASGTSPSYEKRYPGGKTRPHPIPNLAAEVNEGTPYSVTSAQRKWATPTANKSNSCSMEAALKEAQRLHPKGNYTLATQVATDPTTWWPTPTARDYKDTAKNWEDLAKYEHKKRLACSVAAQEQTSGQLNPTWVEWLMGYPLGWTDLSASETV
jgi:hypothetical protein